METIYSRKLESISEVPEQFSEAVRSHISAIDAVRLLLYAPSAFVGDEEVLATVLVVTDDGWLVASENQDGGSRVEQESIKKWVLKPYFRLGSRVNDLAFLGLASGFLIRPA
jgi:hypothetical protein